LLYQLIDIVSTKNNQFLSFYAFSVLRLDILIVCKKREGLQLVIYDLSTYKREKITYSIGMD